MGSISKMVYCVINYHCAKFGVFTINSTIISPFCWTMWVKVTLPSYFLYHFRVNYGLNLETPEFLALGLCDVGETLFNARYYYPLYTAQKNAGKSRISTQTPKRRGTITTGHLLRSPKILCYIVD